MMSNTNVSEAVFTENKNTNKLLFLQLQTHEFKSLPILNYRNGALAKEVLYLAFILVELIIWIICQIYVITAIPKLAKVW